MKLKNSIWLFLILLIGVYTILVLLGDINSIKSSISKFNWLYLIPAFGFFLIAIAIRILRWNYWFHKIEPNVPFKASTLFYLSGFAFSVTPGRMGEAMRSYFIKKDYGITQSKTVPLVLVERFYDLSGLIIVTAIALLFAEFNKVILIIPVSIIAISFVITQKKTLIKLMLSKISKIKLLSKFTPNAEESSDVLYQMLHFRNFVQSSILGSVIAMFDIMGAFMLFLGLNTEIDFAKFIIVISASTIGGGLSFIPGGLGVQEGGILGLLTLYKIPYSQALVFTILYRVCSITLLTTIGFITFRKILRGVNKNKT